LEVNDVSHLSKENVKPIILDSKAFVSDESMFRFLFEQTFSFKLKGSKTFFEKLNSKRGSIFDFESFLVVAEELLSSMKECYELQIHFQTLRKEYRENAEAYKNKMFGGKSYVFWPNPLHKENPSHLNNTPPVSRSFPFITKETKIVSAGSCFAMEIAHYLMKNGFNYVVTEDDTRYELPISSARWGTIFNTPSFCQLIERSFGVKQLPPIIWTQGKGEGTEYRDPFREDVIYKSKDDYKKDYYTHISKAKKALEEAEVIIITLGVNEVWFLRNTEFAFAQAPWNISPLLAEKKVLSVEENLKFLQRMYDVLKMFNPKVKIIISVSPVPLHASFRGQEAHVIEANCHSKSILRVTAEEFVKRNHEAYYLPSYESVMYCTEGAWEEDLRHVKRSTVEKVMQIFETMFVINEK
jgi:hypothetical protein